MMSIRRSVTISAEVRSVGQFDRVETWIGTVVVEDVGDGRVQIGNPAQSGFESITFSVGDLAEAVEALDG